MKTNVDWEDDWQMKDSEWKKNEERLFKEGKGEKEKLAEMSNCIGKKRQIYRFQS